MKSIKYFTIGILLFFNNNTLAFPSSCPPPPTCENNIPSREVFSALHETCKLKLQADLAGNPKAQKLATQAEKLLLKALDLVINAENLLKPIPVP